MRSPCLQHKPILYMKRQTPAVVADLACKAAPYNSLSLRQSGAQRRGQVVSQRVSQMSLMETPKCPRNMAYVPGPHRTTSRVFESESGKKAGRRWTFPATWAGQQEPNPGRKPL